MRGYNAIYTPVMSATPDYSINDSLGAGGTLVTVRHGQSSKAQLLKSLQIYDSAGVGPALTVYLLNAAPGAYTDNGAFSWVGTDAAKIIGIVSVAVGDWITNGSKSHANLSGIDQLMTLNGRDIGVHIVAESAYNGASTSDLVLTFGFQETEI